MWRFISDRQIEAPDEFASLQTHRVQLAVARRQLAFVEQLAKVKMNAPSVCVWGDGCGGGMGIGGGCLCVCFDWAWLSACCWQGARGVGADVPVQWGLALGLAFIPGCLLLFCSRWELLKKQLQRHFMRWSSGACTGVTQGVTMTALHSISMCPFICYTAAEQQQQ